MLCAQENVELLNALLAGNTTSVEAWTNAADFDFGQFGAFTDLHHLSGYLYLHIKGTPIEDVLPQEFLEHLGERYSLQRQRCDDALREAVLIYDTFKAAHQDVLFLKGSFVAQQFYGDIHQRSYWDVDILIPRDNLTVADQLLRNVGFKRLSMVLVSNGAMTRFTHTYDYFKRIADETRPGYQKVMPLDLHWGLRTHFSFHLDNESIWKQQEECQLEGRSFRVLSAEYTLVLNMLGIFFDIELGTIRLKSFVDLYKMLEMMDPNMDWDVFFKKRTQENIFLITINVIDLVLSVLDCRSKFPRISLYIEKNRRLIRLMDTRDKYRLLDRSRVSVSNRKWAHSLYQAPVLQSYLWALISLPFRIAAHDRVVQKFMGRLK